MRVWVWLSMREWGWFADWKENTKAVGVGTSHVCSKEIL